MHINTYFKFDEVRATLGISAKELPDTVLELDMYGEFLFQELMAIEGALDPDTTERNLIEHYDYIKALASPTDAQALLKSYIRMFALYTVAANVADTISLMAPKTISDGKALITRFSSEKTFDAVRQEVLGRKYDLKVKIKTLLGITITDKTYLGVIPPAIDVITDEAYED
jgi:hypothetical protein